MPSGDVWPAEEAPWVRRQVEGHLIFGFFARRAPFGWVIVALAVVWIASALNRPWWVLAERSVLAVIIILASARWILRLPLYRQAAFGWWISKITLAVGAFLVLLVGGFVGFFRGTPEAPYLTLLALLWVPSVEFLRSVVPHQRWLTLGRLLASIPLGVFIAQSAR
jgi:hypothetical protein